MDEFKASRFLEASPVVEEGSTSSLFSAFAVKQIERPFEPSSAASQAVSVDFHRIL